METGSTLTMIVSMMTILGGARDSDTTNKVRNVFKHWTLGRKAALSLFNLGLWVTDYSKLRGVMAECFLKDVIMDCLNSLKINLSPKKPC